MLFRRDFRFIAVWFTKANDLWEKAEELWEGKSGALSRNNTLHGMSMARYLQPDCGGPDLRHGVVYAEDGQR